MENAKFCILALISFLHITVILGNGYCVPKQPCWPTDPDVIQFIHTLEGTFDYYGTPGFKNASYVKNWDYITIPAMVVTAKTVDDVQRSVLFARKYGIKLSVLSSGHDYIGRNTGYMTLMVRMDKLKQMKIFPSDANSPSGASVIAETGTNWGEVYEAIDKFDLMAVGGSAHSVAMGGWFLGGGHSPVSRKLGLGVDQVLSFRAILANGIVANISATGIRYEDGSTSNDTDLFWALRGGGGGDFAIVTHFHFQIHRQPAGGFASLTLLYPWYHQTHGKVGEQIMDFWNKFQASNLTENWGGYVIMQKYQVKNVPELPPLKGLIIFALLHCGPWEEGQKTIAPLTDFHPEWRATDPIIQKASSFWEYSKNIHDDLFGFVYITNRLVQKADLVGPGMSKLAKAFKTNFDEHPDLPEAQAFQCTKVLIGKKTSEVKPDATSVNPSFRTAFGSLTCGVGWQVPWEKSYKKSVMKHFGDELYKLGEGVYYNEPDSDMTDWKTQYWGSQYEKLLEIKKKYDPERFLTCLHCVGSELPYKGYGSKMRRNDVNWKFNAV